MGAGGSVETRAVDTSWDPKFDPALSACPLATCSSLTAIVIMRRVGDEKPVNFPEVHDDAYDDAFASLRISPAELAALKAVAYDELVAQPYSEVNHETAAFASGESLSREAARHLRAKRALRRAFPCGSVEVSVLRRGAGAYAGEVIRIGAGTSGTHVGVRAVATKSDAPLGITFESTVFAHEVPPPRGLLWVRSQAPEKLPVITAIAAASPLSTQLMAGDELIWIGAHEANGSAKHAADLIRTAPTGELVILARRARDAGDRI